ncbi:MAG: DMT family transporter [Gammaproteobacteria bacterium]|nr:DMT family transporter [Gammaproteobacteria bacterium]
MTGVLLMTLAAMVLSAMHAIVRHVSGELHPFEISFFRNLFGFVAVLPLLIRAGWSGLRSKQPGLQVVRGLLGVTAMLIWFYSLSIVPIAQATALSFTAVIFGSIGAVVFLGEAMRLRRWIAVFLGFVGTLVILRPGFQSLDVGASMVLASSVAWGLAVVVVKKLSRTDSVISIVSWMAIMLTVLSFFPALLVWVWPTTDQLLWLGAIGVLATTGHLAMTKALKITDATAVLPLDFTRLIWASVIGYFAFSELPDLWTWLGGGIIVASATYIIYRESKVQRRIVAAQAVEEAAAP